MDAYIFFQTHQYDKLFHFPFREEADKSPGIVKENIFSQKLEKASIFSLTSRTEVFIACKFIHVKLIYANLTDELL